MRFVAGVRWAVRAKDAGSAHMQVIWVRLRTRARAVQRGPAAQDSSCCSLSGEERRGFARLETMTRKILLGLALAGLVVVALTGAFVQLARGQRPALLGT
jgi:hypothetical protein